METAKAPFVVYAYISSCATVRQPPGLGDFILGTASLFNHSCTYGFRLRVDVSDHPVRHVLGRHDDMFLHDYEGLECIGHHEFFNDRRNDVAPFLEKIVANHPSNAYVVLTTHEFPPEPVSADAKRFIQRLLTPSMHVYTEFMDILKQFGFEAHQYAVIHIRSDDNFGRPREDHVSKTFVDRVLANGDVFKDYDAAKILVMSDSYEIKKQISEDMGFRFLDTRPCHNGSQAYFGDDDGDLASQSADTERMMHDTFIELFLAIHASHMFCHSVFGRISGFASIPSLFYNVKSTYF